MAKSDEESKESWFIMPFERQMAELEGELKRCPPLQFAILVYLTRTQNSASGICGKSTGKAAEAVLRPVLSYACLFNESE